MSRLISGKFYWANCSEDLEDPDRIHGPFVDRNEAYRDALISLFNPPQQLRFPWDDSVSFSTGVVLKQAFDSKAPDWLFVVRADEVITHIATQAEALRS